MITVTVLNTVHHSPLLAVCAVLTGAAAYLQSTYVSTPHHNPDYASLLVGAPDPLPSCAVQMDAKLTASDEGDAESSDEEN